MRSTVFVFLTSLLAAGPSGAQSVQHAPQPTVTLPAPLARVLTDYETAWRSKNAAALAALFAEDGFVLSSGTPPVRGRAQIEKHYAGAGGPLALRALAFATEGSLGYIIGGFAKEKGQPDNGKFTLTLRKGSDGRWLILSDMDNGNTRPGAPADATAELRQLTQQRFDANVANDRSFYERLLAPSFLLLDPDSFLPYTKQAYLDAEFPPHRAPRGKVTITDFQAHVEGDTAVVTYQVLEPHPVGELTFEWLSRRLETYVRINGAWRLLSMAAAHAPSWPDVAVIDPKLYSEYAGTYQLTPGTLIVITNEAGHLMAEVTGQEKVELFPENATTFFDRTDSPLARTVFERDTSGKVVAQIYRVQGQQWRARKIQ